MALKQLSTMSVMLYYQRLAEPSNKFCSIMQEGNLLILNAHYSVVKMKQ